MSEKVQLELCPFCSGTPKLYGDQDDIDFNYYNDRRKEPGENG